MLEPAKSIIAKFGGPTKVSAIVAIHRTRVSNWMRPKEKGGTGGTVPQGYHLKLLDYAAANGLPLDATDFLPSRSPAPVQLEGAAS